MNLLKKILWLSILKRSIPVLAFGSFLFYIIFFTQPPKTWTEAPELQILIFFIPLLLFLTALVNLFLNYLSRSFAIALGLFLAVFFQANGILNIATLFIIGVGTGILVKYIPEKRLTRIPKIPKLSKLGRRND